MNKKSFITGVIGALILIIGIVSFLSFMKDDDSKEKKYDDVTSTKQKNGTVDEVKKTEVNEKGNKTDGQKTVNPVKVDGADNKGKEDTKESKSSAKTDSSSNAAPSDTKGKSLSTSDDKKQSTQTVPTPKPKTNNSSNSKSSETTDKNNGGGSSLPVDHGPKEDSVNLNTEENNLGTLVEVKGKKSKEK
ncbi:hypothetical protein [Viridibacillus arvi]|uniref:hypothetical protein n=1 Tax=Viridibacillus arvi TaxID=263475 RepID=UPI0034CD9DD4